jgi:UDP-N-acetylglucosamine 2-epimerase
VVTVVGARPQFVKAAPVSRALRRRHTEVLVHTGQHWDENMSAVFFDELGIPAPDLNLEAGGGSHAEQTGAMLTGLEACLQRERPDWVLVYGDTNSTLAGALAAAKLHLPVAHVEAGLRSFNRRMPEEINRVVADRLSTLLFCPSRTAVDNLAAEGIVAGVHLVGDVMAEALASAREAALRRSGILAQLGLADRGYVLATVHRAENTDDAGRLAAIWQALAGLGETVVFPIHPRTRQKLDGIAGRVPAGAVRCLEPVGYLDMVRLVQSARLILTDSGGLQKEAYWLGVPCLTLRDETEWVETVAAGWNRIVGADPARIVEAARAFAPPPGRPPLYGEGEASARIVTLLESAVP